MTDRQRHGLVMSGALTVSACLVLYIVLFGFQSFDPKSLFLVIGFFIAAGKIASVKHKRHPLI